jgi:hypothetical protein
MVAFEELGDLLLQFARKDVHGCGITACSSLRRPHRCRVFIAARAQLATALIAAVHRAAAYLVAVQRRHD